MSAGGSTATADLAATTRERFGRLIEKQIVPHLGAIPLQQLRPAQVTAWHATLRKQGGKDGAPSPATVRQAHRVLHLALAKAFEDEKVVRNVASGRKLPKAEHQEIQILQEGQIAPLLARPRWPLAVAHRNRRGRNRHASG